MTVPGDVERRYAALEQSLEPQRQRSIARGPIGLIGVLVLLSLAVGTIAAVDLRRLQTPSGTALAWTGAVVFGDCTAYERLSVPPDGADEAGDEGARCLELRRRTEPARQESGRYGIELLSVEQSGRAAAARMRLSRPDGTVELPLELRRSGDGWVVVRTDETCQPVSCP